MTDLSPDVHRFVMDLDDPDESLYAMAEVLAEQGIDDDSIIESVRAVAEAADPDGDGDA